MLISVAGHRPGCAILQSTDPSLAAVQTAAPSSRRCAVSPLVEQTGRFTSKQAFDSPTAFSDNQYVPSTGFAYGVELCILIRVYSIVYDLLPLLSRAVYVPPCPPCDHQDCHQERNPSTSYKMASSNRYVVISGSYILRRLFPPPALQVPALDCAPGQRPLLVESPDSADILSCYYFLPHYITSS